MKKCLFLTFVFLLTFTAKAQYMKMEIWELAGNAELVILGKIAQAQQGLTKITIQIEEVITGVYSDATVEVEKFTNTKYAKRWGKYAENERVVLFLKINEGKYEIMGKGGEGEKLVMANDVYLDGRGGTIFNKFSYFPLLVSGNIYAEKIPLDEFSPAIKTYKSCFSVEYKPEEVKGFEEQQQVAYAKQICDDTALDAYRSLSFSADKLAELSLNHVLLNILK